MPKHTPLMMSPTKNPKTYNFLKIQYTSTEGENVLIHFKKFNAFICKLMFDEKNVILKLDDDFRSIPFT